MAEIRQGYLDDYSQNSTGVGIGTSSPVDAKLEIVGGTPTQELNIAGIATFGTTSVVVDGELQVGWGGDTWGENEGGDLSGSQPILAGQSLSITLGSVTEAVVVDVNVSVTNLGQMAFGTPSAIGGTSILEQPTGFELSISGGTQVVGIGVDVTGVQANSNIGAISIDDTTLTGIGWGRRTWGNLAWGGAYSAQALGQQLTSTINFPADN